MKGVKLIGVTVLAGLMIIAGCRWSPNEPRDLLSDGTAGYVSQELADMGNGAEFGNFTATTAKVAAGSAALDSGKIQYDFTATVEVTRRVYDSLTGWWVRSVKVSASDGRHIIKDDSIRFYDTNNNSVKHPDWETTAGFTHVRHAERHGYVNTWQVDLEMTVVLNKTDSTGTWNGSIIGTLNGEAITRNSNTSIIDVVRKREHIADGWKGYWEFPSAGTINIDRPLKTISITFTGNGSATATITRKSDNKTKTITITVSSGTETES